MRNYIISNAVGKVTSVAPHLDTSKARSGESLAYNKNNIKIINLSMQTHHNRYNNTARESSIKQTPN